MKTEVRKNKPSIKWNVFLYLLIFAGVIILILWLCQVAFLDDIYKSVKYREIENASDRIVSDINSDTLGSTVDRIASGDICVSIYDMSKQTSGARIYSHHCLNSCVIHSVGSDSISYLYYAAKENGGTGIQRFKYDSTRRRYIGIEGDLFEKPSKEEDTDNNSDLPEHIIYTTTTISSDGTEYFIMLNSAITPVNSTITTLNSILQFVTIILVIMALILALLISQRVTKPISRLTRSANELAKGNYDIKFDEKGYREVAELSDALTFAKQELSRVDELRRELIANISHDLRTPLTMITGYSEIMRDIPGENTPENVQVIIDETKRLNSLVNDVLDISKLESGIGTLNITEFNLTESVSETLKRFSKLCEKNGYTIDFYHSGDIFVRADEKRITQAIYNLVSNAITHTGPSKEIKVKISSAGKWARIEVIDYGEGIEEDKLPLIWERYYKVDRIHKRAALGTGLGLSIVRTIMEQHGGNYGVSSTLGKGSIFYIELNTELPGEKQ